MSDVVNKAPEWITKGKTIRQLIAELQTFEDQDLEVRMSFDGRVTNRPISILSRDQGYCILENCEDLKD